MSPHRARKPGRLRGFQQVQRLGELIAKKKDEAVGETEDGETVKVRVSRVQVQAPRPASKARCPHRRQKSPTGQRPVRYYRPCGGRLKLKKHRGPEKLAVCRDCGREWEIVAEREIGPGQVETQLRRWEADAALRRQHNPR